MGIYKVYYNGQLFNRMVSDEGFIQRYCNKNGYSYEKEVNLNSENAASNDAINSFSDIINGI